MGRTHAMPAFSTCAQAAPLRFRRRLPLISALWLDVTPRKARGVRLTARTVRRWPSPKTYIRATKSGGADGVPSSNVTDLKGIAEIDVLIDRLLLAEASARLELVRENILAFDAAFFLRLAARSDTALEDHTRDAMVRLAEQVMTLLDGVVREAERRSDASGDVLTTIVAAAAQDDGQFLVPLSAESVSRMRAAVVKASTSGALDEGVVANAYARQAKTAWMAWWSFCNAYCSCMHKAHFRRREVHPSRSSLTKSWRQMRSNGMLCYVKGCMAWVSSRQWTLTHSLSVYSHGWRKPFWMLEQGPFRNVCRLSISRRSRTGRVQS